jgi:hypothetical protein
VTDLKALVDKVIHLQSSSRAGMDFAMLGEVLVAVPNLIQRLQAAERFIAAFEEADKHCDMLGYLAGDYNDDPFDGEAFAMREEIREARDAFKALSPPTKIEA